MTEYVLTDTILRRQTPSPLFASTGDLLMIVGNVTGRSGKAKIGALGQCHCRFKAFLPIFGILRLHFEQESGFGLDVCQPTFGGIVFASK